MNQGTLSGIVKSDYKEIGSEDNKGVRFTTSIASNPKKPDEKEDFEVVAYGANADLLTKKAKKGSRVNLEVRLGLDKVSDKQYDNVLAVSRVLGILKEEDGADFASIVLGGAATFRNLNHTNSGSSVLNATLLITKEFNGKSSKVYADITLWSNLAESNSDKAGSEVGAVVTATPKPKVVEGKHKIDFWVNSIIFAGGSGDGSSTGQDSAPETTEAPKRQFRGNRTQKQDDIEF